MFKLFIEKLAEEIKVDLPGVAAQNLMAHVSRDVLAKYPHNGSAKKSAVLILLFPDNHSGAVKTTLIRRSAIEKGNHAGQMAFPGGGVEDMDDTLGDTALREAEEEIGVPKNLVSLIGKLTPIYIPVSNYLTHPYVGVMNAEPTFTPDRNEVDEIVTYLVQDLFNQTNKATVLKYVKIVDKDLEIPCYKMEDKVIWGATAMMLAELEALVKRMK